MSKFLLLAALLFVVGQKTAVSQLVAYIKFDAVYQLKIHSYELGECVNLESYLQHKAKEINVFEKNITVTLYDSLDCKGKWVNVTAANQGELKKLKFNDKADCYMIRQREPEPPKPPITCPPPPPPCPEKPKPCPKPHPCPPHPTCPPTSPPCPPPPPPPPVCPPCPSCPAPPPPCPAPPPPCPQLPSPPKPPSRAFLSKPSLSPPPSPPRPPNCPPCPLCPTPPPPCPPPPPPCPPPPPPPPPPPTCPPLSPPTPPPPPPPPCPQPDVIIYEHKNYTGMRMNITFFNNTCSNLPHWYNLTTMSVKTTKDIMLCRQTNCTGEKVQMEENTPLFENFTVKAVMQLPLPQPAVIYEDAHYGGDQFNITFPDDKTCENLPDYFLKKASSVIVSRSVILFIEKDCKGESLEVTDNMLAFGELDDQIASVEAVPPPPEDITLYSHNNYVGRRYDIYFDGDSTCYNLPTYFQNVTSSLFTSLPMFLCAEKDCRGTKMEVTKDHKFIGNMNDKVMSVALQNFPEPAILYEHIDYGGEQFNVSFPRAIMCQNLPDNFINKASSVIASEPVILFTKKNCKGEFKKVKTNVPHLENIHDRIQSVKKEIPAAIFYQEKDYRGRKTFITFPDSNCENLPEYSAGIAYGLQTLNYVTIYKDANCTGDSWQESGDFIPALNNKLKSVKRGH